MNAIYRLTGSIVVASMVALTASADAQVSPKYFRDTFEDMDLQDDMPVSWRANFDENLDASSGDLVIESGVPTAGFPSVDDFTYDDVSIRTRISVTGDPFIGAGVFARTTISEPMGYVGYITSSDWDTAPSSLVIYGHFPDFQILQQTPTSLDPTQTDVTLQFDLVGENITLTAWADGIPKQSISARDNRIQQGETGAGFDDGIDWYYALQDPTPVAYRFFEVVSIADFNRDLAVDGLDLGIWDSGYGGPGLREEGDADGDGMVTGADFMIWQREYTAGVPGLARELGIPEPATLALLACGLVFSGLLAKGHHE